MYSSCISFRELTMSKLNSKLFKTKMQVSKTFQQMAANYQHNYKLIKFKPLTFLKATFFFRL